MTVLAPIAAAITFLSTMAGGYAAIRWPKRIEMLMALAGGVVLAAALLDLLPEAVEQAGELGMSERVPIAAMLVGYLIFHGTERFVHRHGPSDGPDPAGLAGAVPRGTVRRWRHRRRSGPRCGTVCCRGSRPAGGRSRGDAVEPRTESGSPN